MPERMRLAGQGVPGRDVGGLEGVVGVHPHVALGDLGPASAADAVLAREGGVGPVPKGRVQDRGAVLGQHEGLRAAVEHDRDLRARFGLGGLRRRRAAARGGRRAHEEQLPMDVMVVGTVGEQHLAGDVGHRERAAQEPLVDVVREDQVIQDAPEPVGVETAGEDLDVEGFLVEHVDELEPVRVAVLQVLEVLQEHDVEGGAVDVDQDRAAPGFDLQGGAEDGQHRRDARAGRDGSVPLALTGVQGGGEAAGRRHDVQHVARPEVVRLRNWRRRRPGSA